MEIIVCLKQVLDPDLPPSKFSIDTKRNCVITPEGIPLVVNPYDAVAVEAALRIKEEKGGKVTVVSLGAPSAEDVVRKALAMGADEGIVISDPSLEDVDGFSTASILAGAIRKIGKYDLILCGRQAVDWDRGMVGPAIAEYLELPVVTLARAIKVMDGRISVERVTGNGYETLESLLPAVVSVSNEVGQPRIPSGWGIISAARKQIPVWSAADIEGAASKAGAVASRSRLLRLYIPVYERKCQFVAGKEPGEMAAALVSEIVARGVGRDWKGYKRGCDD
jgi:electron transfer flavoprotein beta subunit